MSIDFAQPHWLWIGALVCAALAILMIRAERRRRVGLARFAAASPETTVARPRRVLRNALALAGVGLAFVALARPRAGFRLERTPHEGVDLMFAVDTSKSMMSTDVRPNRLARAKLAVADLVRSFDSDRVGLIAFAGDAFVQAPMTADRTVFLESLDALDTDVIPKGGTDIASAIRAAGQAMASEPEHHKVLVLLSDGEDLAGDVTAAARDAAKQGLTIYTVGVGSTAGSLIEIAGADGKPELVRDASGQPVHSRLDEPTLRSIAQVTGGAYQPLGPDGRGLDTLYAIAKAKLPATTTSDTARKVYNERFEIPLGLAIGCLIVELVLGDRRRRRRGSAAAITLGLIVLVPQLAAADPTHDYNAATSTYRKGDFAAAQTGFASALHTRRLGLQEDAYYDLGNARFRAGEATLAKDRDATIAQWKSSLAAYDAAIALTPFDGDAQWNRNVVAMRLAALQKQKQQQQQNKQQNKQGQGQQPKNQPGQGQQAKNQPGQGQRAKNQQGQGQQPKNQQGQGQQAKNQQGQGQQANDRDAQRPQPPNAPGAASSTSRPGDAKPTTAAEAAADAKRRAAGELTRDEAVHLLDSVEGELKPMAIHGRANHSAQPTTTKDW